MTTTVNVATCFLLLIVLFNTATSLATSQTCQQYNTTAKRDPSKFNVHLIPHTHDDAGWLKTFDQYFWGTRQDIQSAAVQHVLSTVVQCLKDNPDRRFSYAEMSFFSAWWYRQTPAVQAVVRELVAAGRLDFINGGWVQHDEAAAHYAAMIDQTSRGHRFLNNTFGVTPRVAWQIDPFGHSSTQAALMSAAVGFEALFFGRADYQDMHVRSARKQLEMLWRASASWGEYGQIFAQNYPSGNYGPPTGFNFDWGAWDTPIVDDPSSPEYNVPDRVEAFVAAAHDWSAQMTGNDVLFMMGSDFQYANAHAWFVNLDRLIHYVNMDGRVNVFYSSPAEYVEAKASYADVAWPVKTDDFFPYADCPHCYWTGYFTSRPTSKGYIRQAQAYLTAARQLQALVPSRPAPPAHHTSATSMPDQRTQQQQQQHISSGRAGSSGGCSGSNDGSNLDALEAAVSLTQHHDAVTGTEKQAVANDYARLLYLGVQEAAEVVNTALSNLLTAQPEPMHSSSSSSSDETQFAGSSRHGVGGGSSDGSSSSEAGVGGVLKWCLLRAEQVMLQAAAVLGLELPAQPAHHAAAGISISSTSTSALHIEEAAASAAAAVAAAGQGVALQEGLQLVQCPLLNVSVCAVTVAATVSLHDTLTAGAVSAASGAKASSLPPQQQQQQQKQQQQQGRHFLRQLQGSARSINNQKQHMAAPTHTDSNAGPSSSSSAGGGLLARGSVSLEGSDMQSGVLAVVYNSLAWPRREVVRVPVSHTHDATYSVQDADGAAVPSQLLHVSQATTQLQQGLTKSGLLDDPSAAATHELAFAADLPPLGYATYALLLDTTTTTTTTSSSSTTAATATASSSRPGTYHIKQESDQPPPTAAAAAAAANAQAAPAKAAGDVPAGHTQLSTGVLNVTLHEVTGRLVGVSAADGSWTMGWTQELMWYKSSTGDQPKPTADHQTLSSSSSREMHKHPDQPRRPKCSSKPARSVGSGIGCGGDGEPDGGQSSGAYIFRPAGDAAAAIPLLSPEQPVSVTVVAGPVVTEIRQTWASWASLTTRLYAGADTLEQEWTVGPIPTADNVGKEVIVRTSTDLQTGGVLFTDSNGREMLMRRINHRPTWPLQVTEPVTGNYYPITAAAAITDGCLTLGVATDRAQGAASLSDGQLEIMVHRVTVVDDARGVGEPLNETLCGCTGSICDCPAGGLPARGRHVLVLGPSSAAAATLRTAQQLLNDPVLLAFADVAGLAANNAQRASSAARAAPAAGKHMTPAFAAAANLVRQQQQQQQGSIHGWGLQGRWSGVAEAVLAAGGLPANVHLLTLMRADGNDPSKLILRLAHTFQVDEDPQLSLPVLVDLQQLLAVRITDIQELSLTAAQYKAQRKQPRRWKAGTVISADDAAVDVSQAGSSSSWGQALWQQLRAQNGCQPAQASPALHDREGGGHEQQQQQQHQQVRKLQRQQQQQRQQFGPYNIWDHNSGDVGSIVELFPQEIRTWMVTVLHA